MASSIRPVVGIAGATGHLGQHVTSAFLSPLFRDQFSEVILLSRKESSTSASENKKYTTRKYDETNLKDALQGVDILVDTIGHSGHTFKANLARALPHTNVRIYFPSEFGVDHYVHDFPHLEWDQKKKNLALAQELNPSIKICRVFCGLFLEDSIGPWFGFNTKNGKYESVGSSHSPISFTDLGDVGRTVASLAALPDTQIPDTVHIAGDTRSFTEIADIMQAAGADAIQVEEIPLQKHKEEHISTTSWDPANYLRFLIGENKINHTIDAMGNNNDLVNPGEQRWNWKTLNDLAKDTEGQPWRDFEWPPN
ncbi:hypothetical protein N7493_002734 [Penicillium malachiteum]|uniref:NmrA-like domain-containing protein n=1 Tax=Penicillium malachiteum TaxID=1324776 RepID=A0AAD6MYV5_9EURO|nr:hypothetical protein N7493_002734 [Penicillium malachiteum]